MKHFVLAYDRMTGGLETEPFDSIEAALHRRFELERERTDPNIELVTLSGPSLEAIKVTHARYFHPVGQLVHYTSAVGRRDRRIAVSGSQ